MLFFSSFEVYFMSSCRWQPWPEALRPVCLSVPFSWTRYPRNALMELLCICHTSPLGLVHGGQRWTPLWHHNVMQKTLLHRNPGTEVSIFHSWSEAELMAVIWVPPWDCAAWMTAHLFCYYVSFSWCCTTQWSSIRQMRSVNFVSNQSMRKNSLQKCKNCKLITLLWVL